MRGWFGRGGWERRMDAELRFHIESRADDLVRRGLDRDAAERQARAEFGPVELAKDECRDSRMITLIDHLWRDIRYAVRQLRRSPTFTAAAVLTLALGIGANVAIYRLLDAIVLRAVPVANPDQLAIVQLADLTRWKGRRTSGYPVLSHPLWEALRDTQQSFERLLAWANTDLRMEGPSGSRSVRGLYVSGGFFDVLGIRPVAGRLFTAGDDQRGCGTPGLVASYPFWQQELGGSPSAIGTPLLVNGHSIELLGVTPPGFGGLEIGRAFDLAVPICSQASIGREAGWLDNGTVWWLTVMGRLAPASSLPAANAELSAISPALFERTLPANYPAIFVDDYLSLSLHATPGRGGVSSLRTRYGDPLVVLLIVTGLVLLIACTNLANLLMARASAREREQAVRLALGASRARVITQLMIENALVALAGTLAGLGVAVALGRTLVGSLGGELSLSMPFDVRLAAVISGLAAVLTLTFGLWPAWRASRLAVVEAVKGGRSIGSRRGLRARQALIVAQVAVSVLLVFGALLFAATLRKLTAVDPGFDADAVMVARVDASALGLDKQAHLAYTRDLLVRLQQIPGVRAAAQVRHVPFGGTGSSLNLRRNDADPGSAIPIRVNGVTEGYLSTMDIALQSGRDFGEQDQSPAALAAVPSLVNPAFVRAAGIDGNPVGRRLIVDGPEQGVAIEIIGLVPDTKYFTLREDPLPIVFVPIAMLDNASRIADFVIRSDTPADLPRAVRRLVSDANPRAAVEVHRLESSIRDGLGRERLLATLSGFFGLLAAVLAAVGLYGVLAYLVERRTAEIGVRIALGAGPGDILWLVLSQAAVLVAIGVAGGAGLAWVAAGPTRTLVFGVAPHDLSLIALACALMTIVAGAAAAAPARRASRVEPLIALRHD